MKKIKVIPRTPTTHTQGRAEGPSLSLSLCLSVCLSLSLSLSPCVCVFPQFSACSLSDPGTRALDEDLCGDAELTIGNEEGIAHELRQGAGATPRRLHRAQ